MTPNVNAKDVMRKAFADAYDIIEEKNKTVKMFIQNGDSLLIAASNLAMALFSYEMGHILSPEDIDDLQDFFKKQEDKD